MAQGGRGMLTSRGGELSDFLKNIRLADFYDETFYVQHQVEKKVLATYSEPKKNPTPRRS